MSGEDEQWRRLSSRRLVGDVFDCVVEHLEVLRECYQILIVRLTEPCGHGWSVTEIIFRYSADSVGVEDQILVVRRDLA